MPMPLAGETVCGKKKDKQELGLYFPVLTTSPACPQSGDNYISHAEIKNTSIKSIYMEKGRIEPNLGWDGTPYDWTKGVTEIQTDFVDTGAEAQQGNPNLLENSSFPTLQQDRWRFIYENFDVGVKGRNKIVNSLFSKELLPWEKVGRDVDYSRAELKKILREDSHSNEKGISIYRKRGVNENGSIGYGQKIDVSPGKYSFSSKVKNDSPPMSTRKRVGIKIPKNYNCGEQFYVPVGAEPMTANLFSISRVSPWSSVERFKYGFSFARWASEIVSTENLYRMGLQKGETYYYSYRFTLEESPKENGVAPSKTDHGNLLLYHRKGGESIKLLGEKSEVPPTKTWEKGTSFTRTGSFKLEDDITNYSILGYSYRGVDPKTGDFIRELKGTFTEVSIYRKRPAFWSPSLYDLYDEDQKIVDAYRESTKGLWVEATKNGTEYSGWDFKRIEGPTSFMVEEPDDNLISINNFLLTGTTEKGKVTLDISGEEEGTEFNLFASAGSTWPRLLSKDTENIHWRKGETYTISFLAKGVGMEELRLRIGKLNASNLVVERSFEITQNFSRYSATFVLEDEIDPADSYLQFFAYVGSGSTNLVDRGLTVSKVRLSRGTHEIWSPNIGDVNAQTSKRIGASIGSAVGIDSSLSLILTDENENQIANQKIHVPANKVGVWGNIESTIDIPENSAKKIKLFIGAASGDSGHYTIGRLSLEDFTLRPEWSPSPADPQESVHHPATWHYSSKPPSDKSLIWGDISEKLDLVPKRWVGSKWENLHDLNRAQYGGQVKIIEQKAGNSVQIQKDHEGVVGLAQVVKLPSPIEPGDFINLSFDLEEKSRSTGIMARVEFFDGDMQYIHSSIVRPFHNIMVGKRRFNTSDMIKFLPIGNETAHYARISFFGNQSKGRVNAAITKLKAETGKMTTGWSLHEKETGFNLNAGQIEMPKVDGQIDKSRVIAEVAILRSALGENLLSWEEVTRIKATSLKGATLHDYFIENGGYYRYALQPIMADGSKGSITGFYDVVTTLEGFWLLGQEDMQFSFVYDGKIDSINYVKPTAFIETIASRYPYAVRSTETDYRRFHFSGKLTYHQDTQRLLTSNTYTQAVSPQSTNPIGFVELKYGDEMLLECQNDLSQMQDGMVMQRIWRHKLLDWLGDGRPKILKSEAEGNMLVMVDDIQVNPVHTVYGLIADFSCSMIEIGKVDEETLQKFKLRKKEITHDDLRKSLLNEQFSLIE